MDLLEGIYSRRSIRHYTTAPVTREDLLEIMKAGSWAPSGLNNQPWRFVLVSDASVRDTLSSLTRYSRIIREAPSCIAVFLDREAMYQETKDHQGAGACIQNMLLAAHALGLGAVWLGEILKSASEVRELLDMPASLELMAVVAVGHPTGEVKRSHRRKLSELLLKEI